VKELAYIIWKVLRQHDLYFSRRFF